MSEYMVFETAHGFCGIGWNARGISRFTLAAKTAGEAERLLKRRMPHAVPGRPSLEVTTAVDAARRYFGGANVDFSDLSLDIGEQEPLFAEIYAAVRRLGWGETTTYGSLAKSLGKEPQVARDVGQAMAKNPIPLIIPCHRVLAAGGKVGGFSAPGGPMSKVRMLELEGVRLAPDQPAQASLF